MFLVPERSAESEPIGDPAEMQEQHLAALDTAKMLSSSSRADWCPTVPCGEGVARRDCKGSATQSTSPGWDRRPVVLTTPNDGRLGDQTPPCWMPQIAQVRGITSSSRHGADHIGRMLHIAEIRSKPLLNVTILSL